jgi:hypothetical protein
MSSPYLADFIDNASDDLEVYLPAALRGELDFKNLLQMCFRFRQRGMCSFLFDGNPQPFFRNLMQSAGVFLEHLPRIPDAQKVTSHSKPFYDAIAGGFWDCAGNIALASRRTWNQTKEYEDDFLFVWFVMQYFFLGATESECRALVTAHEAAAEGADHEHRDICLGFLDKDGPRFDAGLREVLAKRSQKVEGLVERETMPEEVWSWLRYFSLEGLALVKLADRAGLPISVDYLHVNEALRTSPSLTFDPGAWRMIGENRDQGDQT